MQIKNKILVPALFLILSALASVSLNAQTVGLKYDFKTGDKELDLTLNNYNISAKADVNNFINEISITYHVPKTNVEIMIKKEKMEPAEILLAAIVAESTDKKVEEVVAEYKENKDKGWGVIAKNMGIKPGSKEFHEMKSKTKNKAVKEHGQGKKTEHGSGKGKGNNK